MPPVIAQAPLGNRKAEWTRAAAGTVVIGGLADSTLLTLFMLSTLCKVIEHGAAGDTSVPLPESPSAREL